MKQSHNALPNLLLCLLCFASFIHNVPAALAKNASDHTNDHQSDLRQATISEISQSKQTSFSNAAHKNTQIKNQLNLYKNSASNAVLSNLENRYIVKLRSAPLSKKINNLYTLGSATKQKKSKISNLNSAAAKAYQSKLLNDQKQFMVKLSSQFASVTTHRRFNTLLNGIEISASGEQIAHIKAMPEVAQVYPVKMRYVNLDASQNTIRLQAAWEAVGGQSEAGKGIKIAIVDTGIRNDNPMFSDSGMEAPVLSDNSYLNDNPDYCRDPQGDPNFCNNKLIVARWMDPANYDFDIYQNEYLSPFDFDGHGSHVAGIATGTQVNINYADSDVTIGGVAPASYLMVYKALFVGADGQVQGPDTMLLDALEYAVKDGADVINNSWGAGNGANPNDSIFKEVFENAEAAGVIVVSASGNDLHAGRGQTISCPSCIEAGVSVANTTTGRYFGNKIEIAEQSYFAYQGDNRQFEQQTTYPLRALNGFNPIDDDGCQPLNDTFGSFAGSMVLIDYRHTCTHQEIAQNMQQGGAAAVLLYSSGAFGLATIEPLIPFEGDFAIPVIGISRDTGLAIFEQAYSSNHSITISPEIVPAIEPQYVDMMHPFSSTGPNGDPHILKPDMAAPGTDILSAYSPDVFESSPFPIGFSGTSNAAKANANTATFAKLTGTSMASPHVAGTAALLRQAHPDWSAKQIKSALVSSSNANVLLGLDPARPFDMGAGRLDAKKALETTITTDKVSYADPACIGQCSFDNIITNLGDQPTQVSFSVSFDDGITHGEVNIAEQTLAAKGADGASVPFTLTVDIAQAAPEQWIYGDLYIYQNNSTQQLPIALYANETSDAGILTVASTTTHTDTTQPITFSTTVRNKNVGEAFALDLAIPENAEFIPDTETAEVSNGETTLLEFNTAEKTIHWQGNLQLGKMSFERSDIPFSRSLAEAEITPVACSDGCINISAVVDFNFHFNGEDYERLTISDNGFVIAGATDIGSFSALFNQEFPNPSPLNRVIAPLWSEYDLLDPADSEDSGGGYLRTAIHENAGRTFLIVEWDRVEIYSNEFDEPSSAELVGPFTFQLIIEENTNNIWFNYVLVEDLPDYASIGAENKDGSIGKSLYFDGTHDTFLPEDKLTGITLQLKTQEEGVAQINYSVNLIDQQEFANTDEFELQEDNEQTFDVIFNDVTSTYVTAFSTLQINGLEHHAIRSVKVEASGALDPDSLEIVQAPNNGTATVENGQIKYQANNHFNGADTLSYRVADAAGKYSKATPIHIAVLAVNDPPSIQASDNTTAEEGQSVTLSVTATDVDNDPLTYTWTQTAGEVVSFTQQENSITFTAPEVTKDKVFSFAVIVSDGLTISEPVNSQVTITNKSKSGGTLPSSIILILAFIATARYRRNFIHASKTTEI
ncbi:MAG: S8 family serine peptidase [Paraglaciecola sp.]|uniref:S8 family serine peptidase n=1 Tax=Paraglaciecola sp. TaxID=1920173 RepID=UPI0032968007